MTEMRDGTPSPLRRFMVRGGSCGAGVLDPDAGAGPSWLPGFPRNPNEGDRHESELARSAEYPDPDLIERRRRLHSGMGGKCPGERSRQTAPNLFEGRALLSSGPSRWKAGAYPMRDGSPIVLPRLTSPRAVAGQSCGLYSEPGRRPSRFPGIFRATRPARLLRWKGARRITTTVLRAPADRASSGTSVHGGKGGVAGNAPYQPRVSAGMSRSRRAQGHILMTEGAT